MPEYQVVWEMAAWADSPEEAAQHARKLQLDPTAMVGVFDVFDKEGNRRRVDLDDDEGEHPIPCPDCGEDGGTKCGAVGCPY